jgi:hypothetical protein
MTSVAASAAELNRQVLRPGADRFFAGQLEPVRQTRTSWLKEQLP